MPENKKIPLTEEDTKLYLDSCIRHWRYKKEEATSQDEKLIFTCYCDAFQSMRLRLFGELLAQPKKGEE